MSEENARKMLIQRLRAAYMLPNAYKTNTGAGTSGGGVSGGIRRRRKKRAGGVLIDDYYGGRRKRRVGVRKAGVRKKRGRGVLIDSTYGMGKMAMRKRRGGAGRMAAARHNPWITEVKKYMKSHHISYKEALQALSGSR